VEERPFRAAKKVAFRTCALALVASVGEVPSTRGDRVSLRNLEIPPASIGDETA
jgi:hypothetical protein